ncbi:hypothetical protein [Roseibium suaedae]|uniref:Uncharacterized protein n=1 Tax=Roseibium suaedae TaxID=735517 RepID=A0A1M7PMP6_9HYPH|nr:hypothetical protein [Roseibium suaedae]SHN18529.1 hypothetical protein SAMN05444272_4522 [Roseibium suaedae]
MTSQSLLLFALAIFAPSATLIICAVLAAMWGQKQSASENPFQIPAAPRKARGARPAVTSPPSGRAAGFLKGVKP